MAFSKGTKEYKVNAPNFPDQQAKIRLYIDFPKEEGDQYWAVCEWNIVIEGVAQVKSKRFIENNEEDVFEAAERWIEYESGFGKNVEIMPD